MLTYADKAEQSQWKRDIATYQRMQEWVDKYSKDEACITTVMLVYAENTQKEILKRWPGKEKLFKQ